MRDTPNRWPSASEWPPSPTRTIRCWTPTSEPSTWTRTWDRRPSSPMSSDTTARPERCPSVRSTSRRCSPAAPRWSRSADPGAHPNLAVLQALSDATPSPSVLPTHRQAVITFITDLSSPPADASDVYLRLHLLSHRKVRPHGVNLDGQFALLANVVWSTLGPCDVASFEVARRSIVAGGHTGVGDECGQVSPHDRLRDSDRSAHRRRGPGPSGGTPGRGHDGDARGVRELQRGDARAGHGGGSHHRGCGRRSQQRHRWWGVDHGNAVRRWQGGRHRSARVA